MNLSGEIEIMWVVSITHEEYESITYEYIENA